MTTRIRVLIADDHTLLRSGLRMLLSTQADIAVVGEAADGTEVVRLAREIKPDVVIMDLSMPGPPSGNVIRDVRRAHPAVRVVILTMHDDAAYLRAALAAGASGYLVKRAADTELMSAVRAVHAGRTFVDFTASGAADAGLREVPAPRNLSRREREVLRLVAEGHANQQIADSLDVSVKTVETYRMRLSEKLGLRGRAALYRFASESGILDADTQESGRARR
ncbi:MAG TPA: response regulator transcription factor [Gemmatimonadaceae bacterium]